MKLADEPLAPKKKTKSKVKLAAKAKKAKKRGAIGTATLMMRAYWGSPSTRPTRRSPRRRSRTSTASTTTTSRTPPARPHIASAARRADVVRVRGRRRRLRLGHARLRTARCRWRARRVRDAMTAPPPVTGRRPTASRCGGGCRRGRALGELAHGHPRRIVMALIGHKRPRLLACGAAPPRRRRRARQRPSRLSLLSRANAPACGRGPTASTRRRTSAWPAAARRDDVALEDDVVLAALELPAARLERLLDGALLGQRRAPGRDRRTMGGSSAAPLDCLDARRRVLRARGAVLEEAREPSRRDAA